MLRTRALIRPFGVARSLSTSSPFPSLKDISHQDIESVEKPFGHGSYFLPRTSKGNLPVYIDLKQNACVTEIRKVQGDIVLLRNDLQELLNDVSKDKFKVVMESKKILIKGDHKNRIVSLLNGVF